MNHSRSQDEWRNRRSRTAGCSISHGFSLIELVIVLLIIGFAAALAAPRYAHAMQNYRVDAATRQITHQLAFAQRQARGIGSSITVSFDAAADSIQLIDAAGQVVSNLQLDEPPFETDLTSVMFLNGAQLTFDGYGQTSTSVLIFVMVGNTSRMIYYNANTNSTSVL